MKIQKLCKWLKAFVICGVLLNFKQKLERSIADGFTKEKMMKMERRAVELEEALEAVKLEQEIQMERAHVQVITVLIQQLQVHIRDRGRVRGFSNLTIIV